MFFFLFYFFMVYFNLYLLSKNGFNLAFVFNIYVFSFSCTQHSLFLNWRVQHHLLFGIFDIRLLFSDRMAVTILNSYLKMELGWRF